MRHFYIESDMMHVAMYTAKIIFMRLYNIPWAYIRAYINVASQPAASYKIIK